MTSSRRCFAFLSTVLAIGVSGSVTAETLTAVGRTRDGKTIQATAVVVECPAASPCHHAALWWGTEAGSPKAIIDSLEIKLMTETLTVPLSAYADLSNAAAISIALSQKGFDVTIRGGDAAGSYRAILRFEKAVLKRRRVVSVEFPAEAWEETVYSFNSSNR